MTAPPTVPAYDRTARRLHWWSAIAVFVAAPLGLCQAVVPDESLADVLLRAHLVVALVVVGLTSARLVHGLTAGRPELPPTLEGRHRTGALIVHRALVGLLAGLVVTGLAVWIGSDLPLAPWAATVAEVDRGAGAAIAHRILAYVLVGLAFVHLAGVTFHDSLHPGTIDRMRRPRRRPPATSTERP